MVHLDDSNHSIESVSGKARTNSAQTVLIEVTSFGRRPGLVSLRNTKNTIPTTAARHGLRYIYVYVQFTAGIIDALLAILTTNCSIPHVCLILDQKRQS